MFTMILLIYLQAGRSVNLAGATASGEFTTMAAADSAWLRRRMAGHHVHSNHRDVRVGNERLTAFEKLLHDALEPNGCKAEGACRRAGIEAPPARK